ncbi:MAG: dTDP-4-dehydrorhamnose 3,5-epimerase [Planctomycetota bacterium]
MLIEPGPIHGSLIVDVERRGDARGSFARRYCVDELAAAGLRDTPVQWNYSDNAETGTLRGLHYQVAPHGDAKYLMCIVGEVFDVMVDMREDSPTYGRWHGERVSANNQRAVYIPEGCAHGYMALADGAAVLYAAFGRYAPDAERGVRWDDPSVGIDWPMRPTSVSEKDQRWPDVHWARPIGVAGGGA